MYHGHMERGEYTFYEKESRDKLNKQRKIFNIVRF
jgi:hypothetical protein